MSEIRYRTQQQPETCPPLFRDNCPKDSSCTWCCNCVAMLPLKIFAIPEEIPLRNQIAFAKTMPLNVPVFTTIYQETFNKVASTDSLCFLAISPKRMMSGSKKALMILMRIIKREQTRIIRCHATS